MDKVRVIYVEAEGPAVMDTIRAVLSGAFGAAVLRPGDPAPALAAVDPPMALSAGAAGDPVAQPVAPPRPKRRAGTPRPAKPARSAAAVEEPHGLPEICIDFLERGDLTVKELIERTGYGYGAVYTALCRLRKRGLVEKYRDGEGLFRNRLVKGGSGK